MRGKNSLTSAMFLFDTRRLVKFVKLRFDVMKIIDATKSPFFKGTMLKAAFSGYLIFTLMSVLWVDLNHDHFQDLQSNSECEICLKNGSTDDFIVVPLSVSHGSSISVQDPLPSSGLIFLPSVEPSARAPPVA